MSYLTLDADRLVRDAVDAFLAGRLRPDPLPDTVYATKNSRYRIIAGLVHEASDTSLMGAELVGWLVEEAGSARIEPRWKHASRGVFVERRSGEVVVTSRVLTRSVVSESGKRGSAIPPAPPIPQLKQGPSVAPPALVSLGAPDPAPPQRGSRPPMPSDEEVTKVEKTQIADAGEVEALREISASSMLPPAPDGGASARDDGSRGDGSRGDGSRGDGSRDDGSRGDGSRGDAATERPLPRLPLPDDLDAPTRPAIPQAPATPRDLIAPGLAAAMVARVPDARPSPRLVPPRRSSRPPPPPAASSKKGVVAPPAPGSKRGAPPPPPSKKGPPPAPSSKKGALPPPPPPRAAQRPLPPPVPPPRRGR
jgi:hypothetical protein